MTVLVGRETRVLVQGATGRQGSFHTKLMLEYGTSVVAGVTPGKGGAEVHGVPVFDTVAEAVEETRATASVVFVPPRHAPSAVVEAVEAALNPIVVVTEGIPVRDTVLFTRLAKLKDVSIVGPNSPGIIVPGEAKLGIMPGRYFSRGSVALVSRSGTLTYEVAANLTRRGYGQSIAVGCGGDPVVGTTFVDVLKELERDPRTEAAVVIGEIGGTDEEDLAAYLRSGTFSKPVVALVAGRSAPPGRRMGHAGAIIMGGVGTYESKIKALERAGVPVARKPSEVPDLLANYL